MTSKYSSIVYRKVCPFCKKPLDIPIWRHCNDCGKQQNLERVRASNLKKKFDRRKKK